jgi:O-antigen/teichoic acid export membrane protein
MTATASSSADVGRGPSRVRFAALNFGTTVLYMAVTMAVALVSTPLLIDWLGEERYGAVRVLLEYAGYLTLLELGLGGAVAPMLAQALSRGDNSELRQVLAAAARTYLKVTVVTLLVGSLLWVVLPVASLVPVQLRPDNPAWWSQVLGASSLPVSAIGMVNNADLSIAWFVVVVGSLLLVLAPYRALVEANQRGYQVNLLLLLQALVTVGLSLAFAYRGGGISGQCLANLLGLVPTHVVLLLMALARYSGLVRDLWAPIPSGIRERMKELSRASLKIQVCGRVSFMTDAIIVGAFLGSAQVTALFVTQRLAMLLQNLLGSVGTAVWAGLADLHGRGLKDLFVRRILDVTKLISLLGVATLGPIAAGNASFVSLWVGPDKYGGLAVTLVSALNGYLVPLLAFWGWCFSGTGQTPLVVRMSVLSAGVNLSASVALTAGLRLTVGPLLGTSVAFLTVLMRLYPGLLRTHFDVPPRPLMKAVLAPLVLGAPVSGVLWLVVRAYPPSNLLVLGFEMGVATLVILGLGYRLLLDPSERQEWLGRVTSALPGFLRPRT